MHVTVNFLGLFFRTGKIFMSVSPNDWQLLSEFREVCPLTNMVATGDSCFWLADFFEGGGGYTVLPLSVLPSVQDIFRRIFLSNCWWQKSDFWSQASYRYPILWEAFLDPSDSYFLFVDFVDFYTHLTYICMCTCFVAFF
jgi:hypothetical protein